MKEEIWKQVFRYEGFYEVSNIGRIKSLAGKRVKTDKIRKLIKSKRGYYRIKLAKAAFKTYPQVHQVVALAFIPNPDNKPFINHKNGIKTDNRVENLEWCTQKENVIHGWVVLGRISASIKSVFRIGINGEIIKEYSKLKNVELDGFTPSGVGQVCRGECSHYKGMNFVYKDTYKVSM